MVVAIKFINRSLGGNKPRILIFQSDTGINSNATARAWKVIKNCGQNCYHPFFYSTDFEIGLGDEFGNYSPRQRASQGCLFTVTACAVGRQLACRRSFANSQRIGLRNDMSRGAVNAHIYSCGRILATKNAVAPGQMVIFEFKPTLSICVAPQAEEGMDVDAKFIDGKITELPLSGLRSADIVMTGCDTGSGARNYTFAVENIRKI